MDLAIGFGVFLFALIAGVAAGLPVIYPVLLGMVCFGCIALHRGFSFNAVLKMAFSGIKRSLVVLRIFLFIGLMTALWRASGVIPFLVYYSVQLINPQFFLLFCFLITTLISYLLGTSFGTVGTIGVVLIVLAKSGGVSLPLTAGAIISGAYFGDRSAPTSSCANLVAALTDTSIYSNVKKMLKQSLLPLALTAALFGLFSLAHPLPTMQSDVMDELATSFSLHWTLLIPACIVPLLSLCKVKVSYAMLSSILLSAVLAWILQGMSPLAILKTAIWGFTMEGPGKLPAILSGGGFVSMISVSLLILVSSTYSGIFEGTDMLRQVERLLERITLRLGRFPSLCLSSVFANMAACNQTLAVILVQQLYAPIYRSQGKSNQDLALDISNSAVTIAGLIPWSVACAVPLAILGVTSAAVPYCAYLYLVPLCALGESYFEKRRGNKAALSHKAMDE